MPFVPAGKALDERCEEIFAIQIAGAGQKIGTYTNPDRSHRDFRRTGFHPCLIGLHQNVRQIGTLAQRHRRRDHARLRNHQPYLHQCRQPYESLGVTLREISIKKACIQHFEDLNFDMANHNVTYENAQARERTQILMDVANQMNGMVVGTGDLSELALGWATYNGDHMSMYGVNASIPKTLVKHLVKWVADSIIDEPSQATLLDIVDTPISPELIPADEDGNISQKTEDLVGPYELHDFFLYYTLRFGFRPSKIFYLAQYAFAGKYTDETIKEMVDNVFPSFLLSTV